MKILQKSAVIQINIELTGGRFTVLKPEELSSIIDGVNQEVFGQVLFPNIQEKAAHYFEKLATYHCFNDGNKRTALVCLNAFLNMNGKTIRESDTNLYNLTLDVAEGKIDFESLVDIFYKIIK